MPTVQQLPLAVTVNLTDELMLDQGGTSVSATVAQVLDTDPLGPGLVRNGGTLAADTTFLAPLSSPALTGTPTAPTPPAGDNSAKLATTAFVLANAGAGGSGPVTLTGDVSGSGTGTIDVTLAAVGTAGTYDVVTVDAKGRVVAGAGAPPLTIGGDASGSGTGTVDITLAAVGTPGSYFQVTTDAKGRVTSGGNVVSGATITPSGASAARTLAARAADVIDVLDFGADPTGAADSAPAFTAAMAAVSGGWGRVFVPRGSYKLNSAVNQPSGHSIAVHFDDGADISGAGYLGVDRIESAQGPYSWWQNAGGFFGFAPTVGDAANPGFRTEWIYNTPQNSLSMRVGWDRRYTNQNVYGKQHSGIDIAVQQFHSWPNMYDNSSGWGLWEVIESPNLDEDISARANLSASAEHSEIDIVNNGREAGWTWQSGIGTPVQGMSIDAWGQNGSYGGHILYTYGAVGSYDGGAGILNNRWFCYPAIFTNPNPTAGAGTLVINGTTVNVTAGESLAAIAAAINAAAIANVAAAVNTWGGIISRLVIYSTVASDLGSLALSGTALASLGIAAGTFTTPRGNYAAVVGPTAPSGLVSGNQIVVNGTTVTISGTTNAAVVAAINGANINGVAADTNANGNLVITCYMPLQAGGLVLANVTGGNVLAALGLNPGTYLPPTPPKAFATASSDQTTPICLTTDQISLSATDAAGTTHGPYVITLSGGAGTGWPADVAASISAALTTAGILSSDFTALSSGSAIVAVRSVGIGLSQGVQIRNTQGGTLTLADAHGTPLETLGIAAGTYQPGGYSAGSQTVFMAAEDAIAPGGRGIFIGGVATATDPTTWPHTPMESRGSFLHGIRLDKATFQDNNALVLAPSHAIAWGTKAQGQSTLSISGGTLEFDGAPIVGSASLDAAFGSEVGDMLVRGSAGWVALTPGAQGEYLGANGPGTPLAWATPIPNLAAGTLLATSGTAGIAETVELTAVLDAEMGSTYGDVLYRGASGWVVLAPGTTDQVLATGGPGAAPSWSNLSPLLDNQFGATEGAILYRGATAWAELSPGTAGQVLQTGGIGAVPSWVTPSGGSGSTQYYETWITTGTSWTAPSWVDANTTVKIELIGGGGGGGGMSTGADIGCGGGTGALRIVTGTNLIAASTAYTLAIGAAGSAGGAGTAGGNGGNTTFTIGATTYTAGGGTGGTVNTAAGTYQVAGGAATNGTLNIPGQPGNALNTQNVSCGSEGGSTLYGVGGLTVTAGGTGGINGSAGQGYGAGGSGGKSSSGSAQGGGAGTPGLIHIVVCGT